MLNKLSPLLLHIQEKISNTDRRSRKIRVTADSVTIGSSRDADIELIQFRLPFLAEIKFARSKWWILNPKKSENIRVNGRLVELDHPIEHGDLILLDSHSLQIEVEEELPQVQNIGFSFQTIAGDDTKLWNYLVSEKQFDEILINGPNQIYVDYQGNLLLSPWKFQNESFLFETIQSYTKKTSGWLSWRLDRRLRIQAALPPVVEHPHICIRKARQNVFSLAELQESGFGTEVEIEFLKSAVKARQSILISGATSTGKTVLLRSLVEQIPPDQRLVVIEEESETDWPHPHAVAMESGALGLKQSLKESLRMRPDRLIISEIRGDEAYDFLQAINTGHLGSMTTIHANAAREALYRLENLILGTGVSSNSTYIRTQLAQTINLVIQLTRAADGKRKIESITRITGIQQGVILLSDPIGQETSGIKQDILRAQK